jgi:PHD/YefM family antitoxin component YafN of YafNO toxin-antitoxin module
MPVSTLQNTKNKRTQNVVSALTARTQLGQILKRASEKDERFVVDRRDKPSVIIMSVRDYIRTIAAAPAAYRAIRQEAKKNGTSSLTMRDIDREIAAVRREQSSKKKATQPKG